MVKVIGGGERAESGGVRMVRGDMVDNVNDLLPGAYELAASSSEGCVFNPVTRTTLNAMRFEKRVAGDRMTLEINAQILPTGRKTVASPRKTGLMVRFHTLQMQEKTAAA